MLNKEDQLEQLQTALNKEKKLVDQLQNEQEEHHKQESFSKTQLETLKETNSELILSQTALNAAKEETEEKLVCLQRELSRTHAELQMAMGVSTSSE